MAELVGTAASVIGVAELGFKLSVTLLKYSHAVAHAGDAFLRIQSEVSTVSVTLQELGTNLRNDQEKSFYKPGTFAETLKVAMECEKSFKEVDELVGKYIKGTNPDKLGLLDRLKWPYIENKINFLRVHLDSIKSTLMLMLQVIMYARTVHTQESSEKARDRAILVKLQEEQIKSAKEYQKLAKALESTGSSIQNQLSTLASSMSITGGTGGTIEQYIVVDKTGKTLLDQHQNDDLAPKLEAISKLINEVEQTHAQIKEITENSSIWEISCGTDNRHYRNTVITKPASMPGIEVTRSIDSETFPPGYQDVVPVTTGQWPVREYNAIEPKNFYIALMGAVGAGKSTFINTCCGEAFAQVSPGNERCTEKIGEYHFMYTPEIRVHLIDTPGFDGMHRTDREILIDLEDWIAQSQGAVTQLSGIIYMQKISQVPTQSSAHRNIRKFEKLCGPNAIHSVILVTTDWDFVGDPSTTMQREQELRTRDDCWAQLIERGSSIQQHEGNHESAMRILGTLVPVDPITAEPAPLYTTAFEFEPQAEPYGRNRGMSESSIRLEEQSTETIVNKLLAEYTTVLDMPPTQQRRWTEDNTTKTKW